MLITLKLLTLRTATANAAVTKTLMQTIKYCVLVYIAVNWVDSVLDADYDRVIVYVFELGCCKKIFNSLQFECFYLFQYCIITVCSFLYETAAISVQYLWSHFPTTAKTVLTSLFHPSTQFYKLACFISSSCQLNFCPHRLWYLVTRGKLQSGETSSKNTEGCRSQNRKGSSTKGLSQNTH